VRVAALLHDRLEDVLAELARSTILRPRSRIPSWKISVAAPRRRPPVSAVWLLEATQPTRRPSQKTGAICMMSYVCEPATYGSLMMNSSPSWIPGSRSNHSIIRRIASDVAAANRRCPEQARIIVPVRVVERAHALAALGDDRGGGDALEGDPALLADAHRRWAKISKSMGSSADGDDGAHGRITRLRYGSTVRLRSGGNTTVVNGDSMIVGPVSTVPATSPA
jgi:hypothetical protein